MRKAGSIMIDPNEHKGFCWVTPKEALGMPIIEDLDACIRIVYGIS